VAGDGFELLGLSAELDSLAGPSKISCLVHSRPDYISLASLLMNTLSLEYKVFAPYLFFLRLSYVWFSEVPLSLAFV